MALNQKEILRLTKSCVTEISPRTFVANMASISSSAISPTLSTPRTNPALFTASYVSRETGMSDRTYQGYQCYANPGEFYPTQQQLVPYPKHPAGKRVPCLVEESFCCCCSGHETHLPAEPRTLYELPGMLQQLSATAPSGVQQ